MRKNIALAVALAAGLAVPAFAQTTTTVQTQPQAAPPPPPATTTTVQTQPSTSSTTVQTQPSQPSTQVVVNPNDPPPPPRTTRVRVDPDVTTVETHSTTPPLQIVAVDALYGGLIGTVIGGGITLIEQGNNWQRDLAVGAGVGVLAGAAFGAYDASTRSNVVTHAAADAAPGSSNTGREFAAVSGKF